ncbi:LOW QUALITY PROTEIN: protein NLRC5-like [Colossoma macropomum]|uniref:LOW QUALITY PROTEIN: protein NLRC5-like n=1 Tax=Colossoma macropomum TaxID=42526 RepID=UPI0018649082|nr:LOW QUALITY PROTEIN: protein NLRC5-like [Colossoma macropomum]
MSTKPEKNNASTMSDTEDADIQSCVSMKSDQSKDPPHNFIEEKIPKDERRPSSPSSSCVSLKSDQSKDPPHNFRNEESRTQERRSSSPLSSSVSMKSDQSKDPPHNFRNEEAPAQERRPNSPLSSCVSMKSDQSKDPPHNFSGEESSTQERRPGSPRTSCVSMKSDQSKDPPHNFRNEELPAQERRPSSPRPSGVSMKSDQSKDPPHNFRNKDSPAKERKRRGSSRPSCAFMKSDKSKDPPHNFREELPTEEQGLHEKLEPNLQTFGDQESFKKTPDLCRIFSDLENKIIVFIKHELERFRKILTKENTKYYEKLTDDWCSAKEGALNLALHFLKKMKHDNIADALETNELVVIRQCELKSNMKNKYTRIFEGIAQRGGSSLLNKIYTDLYITEGVKAKDEPELKKIEAASKNQETTEIQIQCNDMFKPLSEEDKPIRTVMTQGIAGIGKSVSVQKFILEWAEGTENQRIKFIFPLPFRELNLKEGKHSLMDILNQFFPETKGLRFREKYKVMFVFDGLDECRLPLNFKKNELCTNETQKASLDVLLTNLIKGNLLPSALIWITTRPAAAAKIPAEFIDRVTEVRGFNDEQKDEYFRKRISDQDLANKIIDHIRESRSLHIMCHIPVFCWISATVLERLLEGTQNEDTPKTLTQMYTRFLIFQTIQKNQKYDEHTASDVPWDKDGILALGKLAFQHLEKNNLIFYSEDLRVCGIEISETSVYSGVCTQETGMFLGTVYSFVHLSIQEFIAALYAYICLNNDKKNVFSHQNTSQENGNETSVSLLKTAVDKALESDKGHLDLFLRFLLGLSLETNQVLIRGLLTHTGSSSDSNKEIVQYIKDKFGENPSPERSINLFYCLNELNDRSLVQEMQKQIKDGTLSMSELSPAQWSALVFVLLTRSEEKLEVFDLKKFIGSDECLKKLLPVVETFKTALLNDCVLTETSCSALVKPLSSESSKLTELDLSDNALQDSGLNLLSAGLNSKNCKLEELRLNNCSLTKESCPVMASIFSLEHSKLKSLELSKNNLLDSGVRHLTAGLEKPQVKLKTLRLCDCGITEQGCAALVSALKLNSSSHLIEVDLSENKVGDAGVEKLSEILNNYSCKLEKLKLSKCCITEKGYAALASALKSNRYSCLMDLDLRENDPGDTGVKMITDPKCKLKTLRLLKSSDAEEACKFLTESVHTNPILQRELDLSWKTLEDSRVKQLSALLADSHCRLLELRLNKSGVNEEGCAALVSALCLNPSHLRTLDLSGNKVGKSGAEKIGTLLENAKCELLKLGLSNCSITEEGCAAVASAVEKNPTHLKELDLSGNKIGGSGLDQLSALLNNPNCILDTLRLSYCHIAGEGYAALASGLKSNPSSHLQELDLRGNDPGDTGVELLTNLLEDPNCKLKTLRLLKRSEAEDACSSLTQVLNLNPLLQTELDLKGKIQGDTKVRQLSLLLEDSHCRLQKLGISDCSITGNGYAALALALKSNPSSHLTELDLRGNDPGDTGVKLLTDLQKDPKYKLETLRLLTSDDAVEAHAFLSESLKREPLLLTELNLSSKKLGPTELKQLSALLMDSHCKLKTLKLNKCDLTEKSCEYLAKVLSSKDSKLTELNLSNNNLGDSGVKKLSTALKNIHCKLETLRLSDCSVGEEGYAALASTLKSNYLSLLKELDLSGNDPGDKGVELISNTSSGNKPRKIRLLKNPAADAAHDSLTKALRKDPLLQTDLDLRKYQPKDVGVKQICGVLEDSHCRLKTLKLYKSGSITERDCADLISALIVNPSHLRELDLNENKLNESGVQKLCILLKNACCKLEKLKLNKNSIKGKGCADLASALSSNLSHLRELDLSENEIQDSGMKDFCAVLKTQNCKLEKLLLKNCGIKEEGCAALAAALKSNSSHLKVLDLCGNKPGTSVNDLAEVLKDSGCKILLDASFKNMITEGVNTVFSWFGFGSENSETANETLTANTGKETKREGAGGKRSTPSKMDEAKQPPSWSGGDEARPPLVWSGGDEARRPPAWSGGDEARRPPVSSGMYESREPPVSSGKYESRQPPVSSGAGLDYLAEVPKGAETKPRQAEQTSKKWGDYGRGEQGTKKSSETDHTQDPLKSTLKKYRKK